MAENKYNISGLNSKVENEGQTNQGKLSATEFNLLVNAAIESQEKIDEINNTVPLKKQITLTGQGNTLAFSEWIYGIKPKHQYKITVLNPEADCSNVTSSGSNNRLGVSLRFNDDTTDLSLSSFSFSEFPATSPLLDYFYFTTPKENTGYDKIRVNGRLNTGVTLLLEIEDIGLICDDSEIDLTDWVHENNSAGYIHINGNLVTSSANYYHSDPIELKTGESLILYCNHDANNYFSVSKVAILDESDGKFYSRVDSRYSLEYKEKRYYVYTAIRESKVTVSFYYSNQRSNHLPAVIKRTKLVDTSNWYTDSPELNKYLDGVYIPSFGPNHKVDDLDYSLEIFYPSSSDNYTVRIRDGYKNSTSDSAISYYVFKRSARNDLFVMSPVQNSGITSYIKLANISKSTTINRKCSFSDRVLKLESSPSIFEIFNSNYKEISSNFPERVSSLGMYVTSSEAIKTSTTYSYNLYHLTKGITYKFYRHNKPEPAAILAFKTTTENFVVGGTIADDDILMTGWDYYIYYYTPEEDEEVAVLSKGKSIYMSVIPVKVGNINNSISKTLLTKTIYFNNDYFYYINLSNLKEGDTLTRNYTNNQNYTFLELKVKPGEEYTLFTLENGGSAGCFALLDKNDKILNIQFSTPSDTLGYHLVIPDEGEKLIVNTKKSGNIIPRIIKVSNQINYIENLEAANGIVRIIIGSNTSNEDRSVVKTPYVPITSPVMLLKTNRIPSDGYKYRLGYAITSSKNDIGTYRIVSNLEGLITNVDYNNNTSDEFWVDTSNWPTAVGISFTIAEVSIDDPSQKKPLLPVDFENYYVSISGNGINSDDFNNLKESLKVKNNISLNNITSLNAYVNTGNTLNSSSNYVISLYKLEAGKSYLFRKLGKPEDVARLVFKVNSEDEFKIGNHIGDPIILGRDADSDYPFNPTQDTYVGILRKRLSPAVEYVELYEVLNKVDEVHRDVEKLKESVINPVSVDLIRNNISTLNSYVYSSSTSFSSSPKYRCYLYKLEAGKTYRLTVNSKPEASSCLVGMVSNESDFVIGGSMSGCLISGSDNIGSSKIIVGSDNYVFFLSKKDNMEETCCSLEDLSSKSLSESIKELQTYTDEVEIDLPSDIYVMSDRTTQLFYRGFIKAINPYNYDIKVGCKIGKTYPRYYEIPPSTAGNYELNIYIRNNKLNVLCSAKTTIHVISKPSSMLAKNILCVGASATSPGYWSGELKRMLTTTSSNTQNGKNGPTGYGFSNQSFVGRKKGTSDSSVNLEATGGWTWDTFISTGQSAIRFNITSTTGDLTYGDILTFDSKKYQVVEINLTSGVGNIRCLGESGGSVTYPTATSGNLTKTGTTLVVSSWEKENYVPFYYDGAVNFTNYANSYCNGNIGTIITLLGVNSTLWEDVGISNVINSAKTFIDGFLNDFSGGKLIISSIPLPSQDGGINVYGNDVNGRINQYGTLCKMFDYNRELRKLCERPEYSGKVIFCPVSAFFDIDNGYPKGNKQVNSRCIGVTEEVGTNGVHPTNDGSYMIADAILPYIIHQG